MSDILSADIHKIDESIFFIVASVDHPYIWLKMQGVVMKLNIYNDNVTYLVKITNVHETLDDKKQYIHRNRFRLWNPLGNRGQIKQISCFDCLLSPSTFDSMFSNKMKNRLFIVNHVFTSKTFNELIHIHNDTSSITQSHLENALSIVKSRI